MSNRFQRYGDRSSNFGYGQTGGFNSNRFQSQKPGSSWSRNDPPSYYQNDSGISQEVYNSMYNSEDSTSSRRDYGNYQQISVYNKQDSDYSRRDYVSSQYNSGSNKPDSPYSRRVSDNSQYKSGYNKKDSVFRSDSYGEREIYSSSSSFNPRKLSHENKGGSAYSNKYDQDEAIFSGKFAHEKNYSQSYKDGVSRKDSQFRDSGTPSHSYSQSNRAYSEFISENSAGYSHSNFENSRANQCSRLDNDSNDYEPLENDFNKPLYSRAYPEYSRRDRQNREQFEEELDLTGPTPWLNTQVQTQYRRQESFFQTPPKQNQNPNKIKTTGFMKNIKAMRMQKMNFKKGGKKFKKFKKPFVKTNQLDNQKNENNKRPREDEELRSKEDVDLMKKKVKFEKITTREEQIKHIKIRNTPLWKMPYEQQIRLKYEDGKKLVLKICEDMSNENPYVKNFLEKQKEIYEGLPCKIHDTIYKEKDYDFYKSKVDLMVGLDSLTKEACVGFRCGSGYVAPISDDMLTIPKIILPHIHNFEKFLKVSEFRPKPGHEMDCVWKSLTFKVGTKTSQVMMLAGFFVNNLKDPRILKAKNQLRDFFKSDEEKRVTSLYLQIIKQRHKNGPSLHYKHVLGAGHIKDVVEGVKFKLKPQSDFPNCNWGAELVCQAVRKLGNVNPKTVLIDICSPLATVSLCLAKDCKQTYFIETRFWDVAFNRSANHLEDITADNNISNWDQTHSKIDEAFHSVIYKKLQLDHESDTLVYLDPWCGLRESGVAVIRNLLEVNRVLFLTCGKKLMLKNFTHLVKNLKAYPEDDTFVPVEAATIDTYPHTAFMAVFILLERIKIAKNRLPDRQDQNNSNATERSDSFSESIPVGDETTQVTRTDESDKNMLTKVTSTASETPESESSVKPEGKDTEMKESPLEVSLVKTT